MGTISDKLTYLNTTKSQLKDMINYGLPSEQQITSSTTFRNYVSSIFNAFLEALRTPDTLFTNLPKKSGSGSVISLNDTANTPMRIELGASELTQDATPTPSSPQAVHTISGSNKVVVNGKNLFDKSTIESGKEISNGTIYNNSSWCVSDYIVVEYNQTYIKNINNGNDCIIYDKDKNKISTNDRRFASNKITITEQNAKYIRVNLPLTSLDTYQLELGNTATTYTPYVSQEADIDLDTLEYCKIGNYEDKFIRTSGKNLFNPANNVWGKYNVWQNDAGNVTNAFTNTFEVKGGEKCSISFKCTTHNFRVSYQFIDNSNNYLAGNYWSIPRSSYNYTNVSIPATATKCIISQLDASQNDDIQIQFEYNTTVTEYEPYGSNEWYIKKNIGKVVLDGSETIATESTVAGKTRFRIGGISNVYKNSSSSDASTIKCDKLISGSVVDTYNDIQCISFGLSSSDYYKDFVVYITDTGTMSTADFITWLGTNNLTVYYRLATPTYSQITGTLETQLENVYKKLLSYTGTTNISQINNDLGFVMSVSAIEEL